MTQMSTTSLFKPQLLIHYQPVIFKHRSFKRITPANTHGRNQEFKTNRNCRWKLN